MCALNSTTFKYHLDIEMFQQTLVSVLTLMDNDAPYREIIPILERLTTLLEEHSIAQAVALKAYDDHEKAKLSLL